MKTNHIKYSDVLSRSVSSALMFPIQIQESIYVSLSWVIISLVNIMSYFQFQAIAHLLLTHRGWVTCMRC